MPPTFEELADAGSQDRLHKNDAEKEQSHKSRIVIALVLLICLGITAYLYWQRDTTPASEPIAAQILLSGDDTATDILPHTKDDSTEFEASLQFLKKDATAPKVRETEASALAAPPVRMNEQAEPSAITLVGSAENRQLPKKLPKQAPKQVTAEAHTTQTKTSAPPLLPEQAIIDWGGTVLIPKDHILAKAYNSDVSILRIEAHPIDGERIRVWARIQNRTERTLRTEVGCEFRGKANVERAHFAPVILTPMGVADTYFVSEHPEVHSYTVMVKR